MRSCFLFVASLAISIVTAAAVLRANPSSAAAAIAAASLVAAGLIAASWRLSTAALPAAAFRWAAAVFAAGALLPAIVSSEHAYWARQSITGSTYAWLMLFITTLTPAQRRSWRNSTCGLVGGSAVLVVLYVAAGTFR